MQLIFGVAFGIALASLFVRATGMGSWQLIVVVSLTMASAAAVGLPTFMVTQAGVWSVIVVTSTQGKLPVAEMRLVDALVGGGVALILAQVLFPLDPLELLENAVRDTAGQVDDALQRIAKALRGRDADLALEAVDLADDIDVGRIDGALELAREVSRRAPRRRRARRRIEEYAALRDDAQHRARHVRVLSVAAARLLRSEEPPPQELVEAVERLAAGDGEAAVAAARRAGGSGIATGLAAQQIERIAERLRTQPQGDPSRHDGEGAGERPGSE